MYGSPMCAFADAISESHREIVVTIVLVPDFVGVRSWMRYWKRGYSRGKTRQEFHRDEG